MVFGCKNRKRGKRNRKRGSLLKRISRTVFVGFEQKTKNFRFMFKVRSSETPTLAVFKFVLHPVSSELSFSQFSKQEKQIEISTKANENGQN